MIATVISVLEHLSKWFIDIDCLFYDRKTDLTQIQEGIAAVGHDTVEVIATND